MELVENVYVSDFTKKTLEQFGWRKDDPIPAELGPLMLRIKDTLPPSSRVDVLIDKDAMKEEDVENIKTMLREAKEVAKKKAQKEQFEEETENMPDSVREMYAQLQNTDTEIIDDREAPAAEDAVPAADTATPETAETEAPAAPEENIVPPMAILPFCPRCGWDMQQKFDVEVTDRDKEDFLVTILGGSRFTRKFELMGGKIVLEFRSMLADENFDVQRQLLLDQNDGLILSEAEWFLRMFEYRMACSLAAVYDANGKPLVIVPELKEFKVVANPDKPNHTALPGAREFVHSKALSHEVTRRLAATHLRKFQRLVEAMEAMALEPSFWNGIG
ncbi:hypothetical protein EBZ39_05440 [bacterium]|nr:hypothetical protein [bacterium]